MRDVEITNPNKELFDGITKEKLVEYYGRISDVMLPHCKGRPVSMYRFPDGISTEGFFQKQVPDYFPDWIDTVSVEKEGGVGQLVVINSVEALLYLANQVTVPHLWLSTTNYLEKPDKIIFDIDPSDEDFGTVKEAARDFRVILERIGLHTFLMTTGGKGLHVVSPIEPEMGFSDVKGFAKKISLAIVEGNPNRYTIEHRKAKRGKRIFLDYLRNEYAQTAVAPYAVRAKKSAPIATPLDWDELSSLNGSKQYDLSNIFLRLGKKDDPWKNFNTKRVSLKKVIRGLEPKDL